MKQKNQEVILGILVRSRRGACQNISNLIVDIDRAAANSSSILLTETLCERLALTCTGGGYFDI
jgi:hypothetical protein